jgi:hypothetical protein
MINNAQMRESEHIRTEKTRGLWILVAPVTAQEHKEIFLLCHYFARRKKRINSNPPTSDKNESANSQAKYRYSHYGAADNPRKY